MALEGGPSAARAAAASSIFDADLMATPYGRREDLEIDDQFMVGDSILVAPLFAGEQFRQVYLPPGDWYDFETHERFEGGRSITVYAGLDKLPMFVRAGGIIPLMPVMQHAPHTGQSVPLEVLHFGPVAGEFEPSSTTTARPTTTSRANTAGPTRRHPRPRRKTIRLDLPHRRGMGFILRRGRLEIRRIDGAMLLSSIMAVSAMSSPLPSRSTGILPVSITADSAVSSLLPLLLPLLLSYRRPLFGVLLCPNGAARI